MELTAGKIIEILSQVPKDKLVYVLSNHTGNHLKIIDFELQDDEGSWPDNHPSKNEYPVFRVED